MSFLRAHWFGLLVSLFTAYFVVIFILVLFSPRQDLQKRGFIPCTETMVREMLECNQESKSFCMIGAVVKNSLCDSKVVLDGLGAWVKGQQPSPWANYYFTPELAGSEEEDEGLDEFRRQTPDVEASMEELRRLNQDLEKQTAETKEEIEEEKDGKEPTN